MSATEQIADAWQPHHAVTSATPISALLHCIAITGEGESYSLIAAKLDSRNCKTVGDLQQWTFGELRQSILALSLPKHFRAYMCAIASATGLTFVEESSESSSHGSNWNLACTKKPISPAFIPYAYTPDGRCYAHLPARGSAKYLTGEQEALYVDLLWLEAQVHAEPSLGEYLPAGLAKRLRKLHNASFPPFKPFRAGRLNERARDVAEIINFRFMNARNGQCYKRMILDVKFRPVFEGKVANSVVFVPSDNELLIDNARNDHLIIFYKMHRDNDAELVRAILAT